MLKSYLNLRQNKQGAGKNLRNKKRHKWNDRDEQIKGGIGRPK
jgi:hypothetical protein